MYCDIGITVTQSSPGIPHVSDKLSIIITFDIKKYARTIRQEAEGDYCCEIKTPSKKITWVYQMGTRQHPLYEYEYDAYVVPYISVSYIQKSVTLLVILGRHIYYLHLLWITDDFRKVNHVASSRSIALSCRREK